MLEAALTPKRKINKGGESGDHFGLASFPYDSVDPPATISDTVKPKAKAPAKLSKTANEQERLLSNSKSIKVRADKQFTTAEADAAMATLGDLAAVLGDSDVERWLERFHAVDRLRAIVLARPELIQKQIPQLSTLVLECTINLRSALANNAVHCCRNIFEACHGLMRDQLRGTIVQLVRVAATADQKFIKNSANAALKSISHGPLSTSDALPAALLDDTLVTNKSASVQLVVADHLQAAAAHVATKLSKSAKGPQHFGAWELPALCEGVCALYQGRASKAKTKMRTLVAMLIEYVDPEYVKELLGKAKGVTPSVLKRMLPAPKRKRTKRKGARAFRREMMRKSKANKKKAEGSGAATVVVAAKAAADENKIDGSLLTPSDNDELDRAEESLFQYSETED